MFYVRISSLATFFFITLFIPCFAQTTETIQIDTYYPAPYGVYAELTTTGNTYLATGTGGPNVGIGTTAPRATLQVVDHGLNTHAFKVDTDIGSLSSFVIHSTDGRVGIGRVNPGTYDSENVKLDIGNIAGNGYMAADDVYLKNPKSGSAKWASQALSTLSTYSVNAWSTYRNMGSLSSHQACFLTRVAGDNDDSNADWWCEISQSGGSWILQMYQNDADNAACTATCID